METKQCWTRVRKRTFEIIEVGGYDDYASRVYDLANSMAIGVNLLVSMLYTFENVREKYGGRLLAIEAATVAFFAMNLLSFLPYYLPVFFPARAVTFRMFWVIRIFRLFRINAYYDSLSVITDVIVGKSQQLISSVFIILTLMVASSLCMYSLEHEAQPEVFTNAFSGIWWSVSTLLTVGYGDIYPITTMGKVFSIFITFLGVGMVAIPSGVIVAVILRGKQTIVPRGNVTLLSGDTLVLRAESFVNATGSVSGTWIFPGKRLSSW